MGDCSQSFLIKGACIRMPGYNKSTRSDHTHHLTAMNSTTPTVTVRAQLSPEALEMQGDNVPTQPALKCEPPKEKLHVTQQSTPRK